MDFIGLGEKFGDLELPSVDVPSIVMIDACPITLLKFGPLLEKATQQDRSLLALRPGRLCAQARIGRWHALQLHMLVRSTPDGCYMVGPEETGVKDFFGCEMIGCEVLGSFSINNFEVKFLEEENPSEQSR
ncbi:hypothetical protein Tco_1313509 [Tanacetum coccineum]